MRWRDAGAWARARTAVEWLVLGAGVAVFGAIGWDFALWEPGLQLALHLVAVGTIAGLALATWRGLIAWPSTPLDLPILTLLAAFALATASALNVGMSLRAFASIVAFALMLPAALLAVRLRPSWVGLSASVPVLLLSVPTLGVLGWRRIEWLLVGAPGLPPLRLPMEGTPFGSVAVPPFVIWPAWALAGLIEDAAWRRAIRFGLVVVGIPLTVLSGSRSAWLAMGAAVAVAGVPWVWNRRAELVARFRRPTARDLALGVVGAGAAALVVALALPRLTAVSSLVYRVGLWRDTLTAWSSDPLLGIGPGFMPIARQAAAADLDFPVRQPHSHNLPLGVLGDAGLVGLAAAVVLLLALVRFAGPWRARSRTGWQASVVLVGLGVGGLFEDLTFEPNVNLLAIGLVAVALTDAGAVRWRPLPAGGLRRAGIALGSGTAAFVLLAAMVTADAGSIAYRAGLDAAAAGRPAEAAAWFGRSIAIDPWHPAGQKSLAVSAAAAGDVDRAREAAEAATRANPGDAHSWTNLMLLCRQAGDHACAGAAAERAVATVPFLGDDALNAALVLERLGRAAEADRAYRVSLLAHRSTSLVIGWPRTVTLTEASIAPELAGVVELNLLLAARAVGDAVDPADYADPAVRALAHAMRGERSDAAAWVDRAIAERPDVSLTWEVAVLLHERWETGEADRLRRIATVVRGVPLPEPDAAARIPTRTWDIATFRGYPGDELLAVATRITPEPPLPWALEALLPDP